MTNESNQAAAQLQILRLPAVCAKLGLGRDAVYKLVRTGELKAPLKITDHASGWYEHEVDDFLRRRAQRRDARAAKSGA